MIPLQAPAISYFSAIKMIEDEWSVNRSKKEEVDSLGSVVRIKEAEAQMFQSRADHARGEAVSLRWLAWLESEKLYEVYFKKISKFCLQKTEERWRKKLEELKTLEDAHYDFCEMKMRLDTEIAGLFYRMEAAKKPRVQPNLSVAYFSSNLTLTLFPFCKFFL